MASAAADIYFEGLTPAELRQWVEDHPDHVDDRDFSGQTALHVAATYMKGLALVQCTVTQETLQQISHKYNTILLAWKKISTLRPG
jgi:hypothetical protein